jgi:ATP-dependent Clp protease protease subunit
VLLVHERQLDTSLELKGPIKACIQIVTEQLRMLETAQDQEFAGFRALIKGSNLSLDDLYDQASKSCYLGAREALELGLIAEILN